MVNAPIFIQIYFTRTIPFHQGDFGKKFPAAEETSQSWLTP